MRKQTKQLFLVAVKALAAELAAQYSKEVACEANDCINQDVMFALAKGTSTKVTRKAVKQAIEQAAEYVLDDEVLDHEFDGVQEMFVKELEKAMRTSVGASGTVTRKYKLVAASRGDHKLFGITHNVNEVR